MEIMLHVTLDIVQTPPISDMIIETGVALNIDRANVDATSGEILIDVDDNKMGPVCDAFKKRGVVRTGPCRWMGQSASSAERVSICIRIRH